VAADYIADNAAHDAARNCSTDVIRNRRAGRRADARADDRTALRAAQRRATGHARRYQNCFALRIVDLFIARLIRMSMGTGLPREQRSKAEFRVGDRWRAVAGSNHGIQSCRNALSFDRQSAEKL
jgi:hypothetical protein